jgi:hypothetical protein
VHSRLLILCAIVISVGLVGTAFAHKSEVVGKYKLETGWEKEPPIVGNPNSIEVTIVKIATNDKKSDPAKQDVKDPKKDTKKAKKSATTIKKTPVKDTKSKVLTNGVSGLSENLEVSVKIGDKKTPLKMTEDPKIKGRYLAPFTPDAAGYPTVHVYTKIDTQDIEVSFHPEKVENIKKK